MCPHTGRPLTVLRRHRRPCQGPRRCQRDPGRWMLIQPSRPGQTKHSTVTPTGTPSTTSSLRCGYLLDLIHTMLVTTGHRMTLGMPHPFQTRYESRDARQGRAWCLGQVPATRRVPAYSSVTASSARRSAYGDAGGVRQTEVFGHGIAQLLDYAFVEIVVGSRGSRRRAGAGHRRRRDPALRPVPEEFSASCQPSRLLERLTQCGESRSSDSG